MKWEKYIDGVHHSVCSETEPDPRDTYVLVLAPVNYLCFLSGVLTNVVT